jgi:hypothetical protein
MAVQELGGPDGFGDFEGGEEVRVAPGVSAVFSRGCEADTWILEELADASAPDARERAAWRRRRGGAVEGVAVVSDDRRVQDGVLFAAMEAAAAASGGGGGEGGELGGGGGGGMFHGPGAPPSLMAWGCSELDAQLDGAQARGRGGGASAAWAQLALGGGAAFAATGRAAGGRGGYGSGSDSDGGGWPDGDYDDANDAATDHSVDAAPQIGVPAAAADVSHAEALLTPDGVAALLIERGDELAAADADLAALLGLDLGGDLI